MTKLTIHADCNNAPEKHILRDLNIAFAHADVEAILNHFTDDIHWQIVGETDLRGNETVRTALEAMQDTVTTELTIHATVTHSPEAAVHGVITTEQGGSFAFCDIYRFASPSANKINAMTSYVIALNDGD